jgi:hypothetical protein
MLPTLKAWKVGRGKRERLCGCSKLPTDVFSAMSEKLVVLSRTPDKGFGFSLVGGGPAPLVVSKVQPDTAASASGQVNVGDNLLEIDGVSLAGYTTFRVRGRLSILLSPS